MNDDPATQRERGRLFVCRTCARGERVGPDERPRGEHLARAVQEEARATGIAVRVVECLNGCPNPCTAALRAPGKATYRFAGLTEHDVADLVAVAAHYASRPDGQLAGGDLPESLGKKIASVTPPTGSLIAA